MSEYKWVYAIGELDYEFVENASSEKAQALKQSEKRNAHFGIKRVAIIVIAALVATFGLLMMNEKVRAAVFGIFVRRTEDGYVRVHFEDVESSSELYNSISIHDVSFKYIPEGFVLREVTEQDLGEAFDSRVRMIRFIRAEDSELTEQELENGITPQVVMWITRAGDMDWGYDWDTYDMTYFSTINGMDALIIDFSKEGIMEKGCSILFSDEYITIRMSGYGIEFDDVIKIADNIVW